MSIVSQLKSYSLYQRIKQPINGMIRLDRQRIFILPTSRGLLMLLTIALILFLALTDNNNLIYFIGFLLFSIFFITTLHTFRNLYGLEVTVGYAPPVFAGEAAGFNLTVHNPFKQYRAAITVAFADEQTISLNPYETITTTLYTHTSQRGWLKMPKLTIAGRYPLGIYRAWSPVFFADKVLVYPKPAAHALPFPAAVGLLAEGEQHFDLRGNDDYYGIRSYQQGDSLRQIHWQSYAKGLGMFSKQYASPQGNAELWLNYELTPGRHVEERLSQLCRWVIDAEYAGISYGLKLPTVTLNPANGQQHYAACLAALALF